LEFVRHTGATDDEKLRLLFVAITRAKTHLYMTNATSDFAGKHPGRLEYLAEAETKAGQVISPYLPTKNQAVIKDETEAVSDTDLANNWIGKYIPRSPEMKVLLQSRLNSYRLSPTNLLDYLDVGHAGPQEFLKRHILKVPYEQTSSLSYGLAIHAAFDFATKNQATNDEIIEFYQQYIHDSNLTRKDTEELIEKGRDNLQVYLQVRGEMFRASNASSEVAFFGESIQLGDILLTGKIDRIEVNKTNKTITVVDFKTGRFKDKNWDSDDSLHKYKLQLEFYKLLIEHSRQYANYKVNQGRIEFVTPDDKGEVHAKTLDFTSADTAKLKDLLGIVWQKIKNYDFPETDSYKSLISFEKDLLAGKI
ncbi:PD-(D/E)XK nuclease family protein, partial [Candidatus Saccharibacteria bacterium]|nr:PD-(D/E)XK nuclease family protein [Candidatus Saccharibacteria bacterium]